MPARILVVEDDAAIRLLVGTTLGNAGFSVQTREDAESAWKAIAAAPLDMLVLDWLLPGMSGFELLRRLRASTRLRDLPVLMLTARDSEADMISALDAGADDYVTKPFSPRELVARIHAVLRRHAAHGGRGRIEIAGLQVDCTLHIASLDGQPLPLSPVEIRLLHTLMSHAERVHSRRQLISRIWGDAAGIDERSVDVTIWRLRNALEKHGQQRVIQTVRGAGYRFSTQTDF